MRVATGLMRLCGITLPGKGSLQYVEPVLPLHGSVGTLPQGRVVNGSKMLLPRSEEHTSELQSPTHLACRLLLEKRTKPTGATNTRGVTTGTAPAATH